MIKLGLGIDEEEAAAEESPATVSEGCGHHQAQ